MARREQADEPTGVPGATPTTEAERRMLQAWATSGDADLCGAAGQPCRPVDAHQAGTWDDQRTVRATFVQALLVDAGRGGRCAGVLRLHGARVVGPLDLAWLELSGPSP